MVALYRCGRQAEALRAYRELRETLVGQLGIEPSPALGRLEAAILQQQPELDWRPAQLRPSTGDPAVADVPDACKTDVERPIDALLLEARDALGHRRWQQAFNLLSAADRAGSLGGEDLDGLAEAALWLGRPLESLVARQRAHAALVEEGAVRRAAMVALVLSVHFAARLRLSVAGGWLQRAQRLLKDQRGGPEHGFLSWVWVLFSIATGHDSAALEAAQRTFDLGCRFAVPNLQALGLTFQGYVRVHQGRVREGLSLMDEGMTWAVGGQVAPLPSSFIFCYTIRTCYELGDYRRRRSGWMPSRTASPARASRHSPATARPTASGSWWVGGRGRRARSGHGTRAQAWSPWS
ncbi:MAG: BTAD domain-containing putative transcriptional regulator [Pseudonocardiaceae bacterium]